MDEIQTLITRHQQQHLLRFWNEISDKEKEMLLQDIQSFDIQRVCDEFARAVKAFESGQKLLDGKILPIPDENVGSVMKSSIDELNKYETLGLKQISDGKVAVLLMAGGQGTRLGFNYPKGMFCVGLPSDASLFQLQALRIRRLQQMAKDKFGKDGKIQWYIMTSDATDDHTIKYFKDNNYFGLNEDNVKTFRQSMFPCFDFNGKILLDEKHSISKAPDGNGGLYSAIKNQGILEDMYKRRIESVHVFSVDNILIKVADPVFIGYCLSHSADAGAKAVEKTCPTEAVGVICKVNGKYRVVEYSEIKPETTELRREDGSLLFNAGNICNHYFSVDFLKKITENHLDEIDLHVAKKKIPFVDENNTRTNPTVANGIKIEKFIFDVFKFASTLVVWQVDRKDEFSPLKNSNSTGIDCSSTAKRDLLNLHKKWILAAGAKSVENEVEVSPLLSYFGENLTEHVKGKVFNERIVLLSTPNDFS